MTTQDGRVKLPTVRNAQLKTPQENQSEYLKALKEEVEANTYLRRAAQERQLTEQITNPMAPEPPVKVTGEISMGKVDLQEQARQAQQQADQNRKEMQDRLDAASKDLQETQKQLHSAELKAVEQGLQTQITLLTQTLQKNQNQPGILEQIQGIEAMAKQLGFSKSNPEAEDWNAKMAFKELEHKIAMDERRYKREEKKDQREWDIKMEELKASNRRDEEQRKLEEQKANQLASIPQQIGSALAQGLMARGSDGGSIIQQQPAQIKSKPPIPMQAGIGEAGDFGCPTCKTSVGIGPSSKQTVCPGCNQRFTITRVEETTGDYQEEGEEIEPAYDPSWRPV